MLRFKTERKITKKYLKLFQKTKKKYSKKEQIELLKPKKIYNTSVPYSDSKTIK